jgi:acyl-CoA hydrolase
LVLAYKKRPKDSRVVMTELVLPHHTNQLGTVFGGAVMSWMDICGAISAFKHVENQVVTASIDDLHFLAPVRLGGVIEFVAQVCFAGHTSVDVFVQAWSQHPGQRDKQLTAQCFMTFAARTPEGQAYPVPELLIETEQDRINFEMAKRRRELRLQRKNEFPTVTL